MPRGGGTSLDGESVPPDGGVVVDLSAWSRVLEVDGDDLWARVEPGVVNRDLQRALLPHGLFFPPNPGSWTTSTIGGNVGTNASGMRSFRYGPTRAWVREVDAVLGTGDRVHLGRRVAKRSVGPDLLQLFVGSEGTLGIATELTVRLAPVPTTRRGVVVPLPSRPSLGSIVSSLARLPDSGLSAVEYLDAGCAAALSEARTARWRSGSALLLLEVEAGGASEASRRLTRLRSRLAKAGVPGMPAVFEDADELWTLRGESGNVLLERYGYHVREDVAVPVARIDDLLRALARIARRERVPYFLFGHLGEGSLHPNYVVDPTSAVAQRIRASVLSASRSLGGTISAEHGVGILKRPFLAEELGTSAIGLLTAVKTACDPDGILNPGKLYPPSSERGRPPSWSPSAGGVARARRRLPIARPTRVVSGGTRSTSARPRRRAARP